MNAVYNISQLFEIAFGIRGIAVYDVGKTSAPADDVSFNYSGLQLVTEPHEAARLSALGTPIILPITFKGKQYQVFNELGDIALKQFEDFELPAATLVNFRRAKITTRTKARAANGTVKEMFGFDDWRIDIRGFCLADTSHQTAKTAYAQKLKLFEFDKIIDSIQIAGELFNDLDVSNIVIDELNFDQLKGAPGIIPFYMRCSSDEPLELIL